MGVAWDGIIIEPKCLSLPDMKGEVITPKGLVKVEWRTEAGKIIINGQAPKGVKVKLKLPRGQEKIYNMGGIFKN